ncbi:MAG: trypsin-like serine protease, partial [Roseiflexaceae bacterium]
MGVTERIHAEPAPPSIVGGDPATPNEFPWQIALTRYGSAHCGGSLISANWVVTAAHCVTMGSGGLRVELGIHNIWSLGSNPYRQSIAIEQIIIHPQYGNTVDYGDYDIALIKLQTPASLNTTVKPITLASSVHGVLYTPSTLADPTTWPMVSGWGATSYGGGSSQYLRKVAVPLVSNATCNSNYAGGITERMVCAGLPQGGKDSCQGDSGGPLFINDNGIPVLIGIVSFGQDCALPNYPGVYTHVAQLYPWVASYVPLGSVPTYTPSLTATPSTTRTPSLTATPSTTRTPSNTATASITRTPSLTFTPSTTRTPSNTATASRTFTASRTGTMTMTPSMSRTWTRTFTPSHTRTASNTRTPSRTRTATVTRSNTRTATITLTATPQPEWMRRVPNGGFEDGNTAWDEVSTSYPNIITLETLTVAARSGQYLAWFGGANDEVSVITQTLQVRADARFLRIHYLAASHENDCKVPYDTARIIVNDTVLPGGDIALCKAKNVSAWRALTFNMSAYINQIVTLRIEVRTDV